MNKLVKALLLTLLLFVWHSFAQAHYPPNPGDTRCGQIEDGKFYSSDNYYPPPNGTPAVNGNCKWVQQTSPSCSPIKYNGVWYYPKPFKWVCTPLNAPLDPIIGGGSGYSGYFIISILFFICYIAYRKIKERSIFAD